MEKTRFALLLGLLIFFCPFVTAQQKNDARTILDATASKIHKAGGVQASFNATSYTGSNPKGDASGTLYLKGNKYHILTENMVTWYDGKTQWTYVKANQEVNVSNPTQAEQQSGNPYAFINMYKSGFKYSLEGSETLRGEDCYTVRLVAENKNRDIQEVLLSISKKDYMPLCIRMRQGSKNWTRISVSDIKTKQKWNDSFFRFNSKDFPQAEVIDLR